MSSLADVMPEALAELSLPTLAVRINEANRDAQVSAFTALEKGKLAGDGLWAAKALCPHGTWMRWLRDNMDFSQQTALNYMRLSKGWAEIQANSQRVVNLSLRQALELLSDKPEEPEPAPDLEATEPTPSEPMPAELFGVPVWFDGGENEPSIPQQPVPVREEAVGEQPVVMAHVGRNSGNNEWYTPEEYIKAARLTLGGIDLDPASSAAANTTVRATTFYTVDDDGLTKYWEGRVWMNPPYAVGLIDKFIEKLCLHFDSGDVSEAIVLVNNATETAWFQHIAQRATVICFPKRRVRFLDPDGNPGAPLQGQAVIYLGDAGVEFAENFADFGFVL